MCVCVCVCVCVPVRGADNIHVRTTQYRRHDFVTAVLLLFCAVTPCGCGCYTATTTSQNTALLKGKFVDL